MKWVGVSLVLKEGLERSGVISKFRVDVPKTEISVNGVFSSSRGFTWSFYVLVPPSVSPLLLRLDLCRIDLPRRLL